MKNKLLPLMAILAIVATIAIGSCKDDPSPTDPPPTTISAFGKDITVDFTGAGLTQAQADTIKGKLQTAMSGVDIVIGNEPIGMGIINSMLNKEGFKIVIQTGTAYDGCKRVGNTMAFHKNWLLANDTETIQHDIGTKVLGPERIFAD